MTTQKITLNDRYDLDKSPVLLNGTQALVRLMLMQKARDTAAGMNTAGYVTGYRGSPLGAVDMQMTRALKQLAQYDVTFQPGLNEDLAATALWGAQQAELRGEGTHFVPLDACIETLRQTGIDMSERYKETSLGGLAVNVPNC